MTRQQAYKVFLKAVEECVPEEGEDWPARRQRLRNTAMKYCHIAVDELIAAIGRSNDENQELE